MAKNKAMQYYAVILSVGYGIYDDWDKVEALRAKGFHKKGSHYFHTKKFPTYYNAACYLLKEVVHCGKEYINICDITIPTIVNQIYFYTHLGYLSMDELAGLQQIFSSYQEEAGTPAAYQSAKPIDLVRFDRE